MHGLCLYYQLFMQPFLFTLPADCSSLPVFMSFLCFSGIYISMYSDCLDLNRWYHGKSGFIAIIRLTKVLKYGNYKLVLCLNVVTDTDNIIHIFIYYEYKSLSFIVANREGLKRFLRTTPRTSHDLPLVLTVMCQRSCLQCLPKPVPFLPLRERR